MKTRNTDDVQVGYAQQQFIGWQSAQDGRSLLNLVKDMGLRKEEWEQLKTEEYYLPLGDVSKQEIDEYFGIFKNKKRK